MVHALAESLHGTDGTNTLILSRKRKRKKEDEEERIVNVVLFKKWNSKTDKLT